MAESLFRYTLTEDGLRSWERWMATGYYMRLRSAELVSLVLSSLPVIAYTSFLCSLWMAPTLHPSVFFFAWALLGLSAAAFVLTHVVMPGPLSLEANRRARQSVEVMMYHARLHSEIQSMTEEA